MKLIENFKLKIENSRGYTLIELLAVMLVLTAVGTIIGAIFVSALRGGNKSTTTNDIRQNGNYAITQMSKMIAFAKSFNGITDFDRVTHTNCVAPEGGAKPYASVTITSFDDGVTTFSCEKDPKTGTYGALASRSGALQPIYLIDTNTINVFPCNFTCTQANLFSPITININMTLQKQVSSGFSETQTVIPFNTSVTLRNSP